MPCERDGRTLARLRNSPQEIVRMRAAIFSAAAMVGIGLFLVVAATLGFGGAAAGLGSLAIVGVAATVYVVGDATLPQPTGGGRAWDL
jgi:hypothetical protein